MTKAEISAFMAEMGRKGGLIGGRRRMETLSPARRSALASHAARARWNRLDGPWWHHAGAEFVMVLSDGISLDGRIARLTKARVYFHCPTMDDLRAPAHDGCRDVNSSVAFVNTGSHFGLWDDAT